MSRRFLSLLCLLAITCGGLSGCASAFGGRSKAFRDGQQWEPEVSDDDDEKTSADWRSEPAKIRGKTPRKPSRDSWLDDMIWSSESKDIARSLDTNL